MYYVYMLINPKTGDPYNGYTSDLRRRFEEHQRRTDHQGWKLIYYEAYLSEGDARNRERKLKQYGAARSHLKSRLEQSVARGLESAG